jgi:hypothetical protein
MTRDDYHRCKYCKKLFKDEECIPDPDTGELQCPNGCKETFTQPPYEAPTNN